MTLKDKIGELADVMTERKLDILGIAETRLKGEGMRMECKDYVWKH